MAFMNPELTAQENLLALVVAKNSGLAGIVPADVTFGTPTRDAGTEAERIAATRNTTITITASGDNANISGTNTLHYKRLFPYQIIPSTLGDGQVNDWDIGRNAVDTLKFSSIPTEAEVLTKIEQVYGIPENVIIRYIGQYVAPVDQDTDGFIDVSFKGANAAFYIDDFAMSLGNSGYHIKFVVEYFPGDLALIDTQLDGYDPAV